MDALSYPAWLAAQSNLAGIPAKKPPTPVSVCPKCLSPVGPGKSHHSTRSTRQENLENIVRDNSERTRSKITGRALKQIAAERGVSSRGGSLGLRTGGPQELPVRIGKGRGDEREAKVISNDEFMQLQQSTGLSDSKLLEVRRGLVALLGQKKVEPYLKAALTTRNRSLSSLFSLHSVQFLHKQKDGTQEMVERPAIVADIPALVAFLIDERDLDPDTSVVQFGLDGGQNILKVCLIVRSRVGEHELAARRARHAHGRCGLQHHHQAHRREEVVDSWGCPGHTGIINLM